MSATINWDAVKKAEADNAPRLCEYFFPDGRTIGREWLVGKPEKSLKIRLNGTLAGTWYADNLKEGKRFHELVAAQRNCSKEDAARAIGDLLGISFGLNGSSPDSQGAAEGPGPAGGESAAGTDGGADANPTDGWSEKASDPRTSSAGWEGSDKDPNGAWLWESLVELAALEIDPLAVLFGNRWLERGQGLFMVAPSGMGKSVWLIQLAILAAAGRSPFGIKVERPLKFLIVQSEDSQNDRIEMAKMLPALGLSESTQKLVHENVRIATVRGVASKQFLERLDATLEAYARQKWQADVVAINPLTAYLGGDETKPDVCTGFLRVGLDPILARHNCGVVIVHHPPKTSQNSTDKFNYSDWQYRMAGSHHLTNWARATIGIEPTITQGVFRFIAGKRGQRIGWTDPVFTMPALERYFRHSKTPGVTLWEPASDEDIRNAAPKFKSVDLDKLLALVPIRDPEIKKMFEQRAGERLQIGRDKIQAAMQQLELDYKVFTHSIPNPGKGRAYAGWARTPPPEPEVS